MCTKYVTGVSLSPLVTGWGMDLKTSHGITGLMNIRKLYDCCSSVVISNRDILRRSYESELSIEAHEMNERGCVCVPESERERDREILETCSPSRSLR